MFSGYNLKITKDQFEELIEKDKNNFEDYKKIGENHLKNKASKCKEKLTQYILNGVADGTKVQNLWFPEIKADIFLSHSHSDNDLVLALAGWLHDYFGLDCFIDSCVWGYIDELLEEVNIKYSDKRKKNGSVVYSHKKCNVAAGHVNMMLCMALQKMIDRTESVFVINTENSIHKYSDIYDEATYSPWIYSEILFTELVRTKELSEYRPKNLIKSLNEKYAQAKDDGFKAIYKVSLNHLESICSHTLESWKVKWKSCILKDNKYSLDELYKITNPEEMKNLILFENTSDWCRYY